MTGAISRQDLLAALDLLEEVDARNIAWGLTDESWTKAQIVALLEQRWEGDDPEACIEELTTANLLVKLPREWPNRYRTRMAESVRLFAHLRQLLPGKPWQAGSSLVSDYRFLRRPRNFPNRDIPPGTAVAALQERGVPARLLTQAERILGDRHISRFQLDATAAVFSTLESAEDSGVVVGAGTGSGKTLAFYLPALAALAAGGAQSPRVVAIYPRNELLKDQLATAMAEVAALRSHGGPALTVGAYFGPTPFSAGQDPSRRDGWWKRREKWICPFLKCPAMLPSGEPCGGDLAWQRPRQPRNPLEWGKLDCQRSGHVVEAGQFLLTRQANQKQPPDILFTTNEMLNLSLSDGWARHVFGLGPNASRKPRIVLLDEIHTYSGTAGAQAALLLRRWRHLLQTPITWVGLSATLANATEFFSDLCGVPTEEITDVRPDPDDITQRGAEYQLLLRGDPASQSALLSTTIQSLMLLRRVLDKNGGSLANPFGTRVFAFLENLDLVNRLFRQLLSAEGRDPIGKRAPNEAVLAGLRLPDYARRYMAIPDEVVWDWDGQYWWLPEALGFGEGSLVISRTSSQDAGVNATADIVVASSALEVGYDDPRVGGVLQHKAPHDIASFLQRRGRAGRLQHQRPWTVVVLSDYGRDRLVFQSYESILDPSIPAKHLPLGNQSVRKMQAAMCLLDWAATKLNVDRGTRWGVRRAWSSPGSTPEEFLEDSLKLLEDVMAGRQEQQELVDFVRSSLSLRHDELHSVCWEQPRALLLEVVPTAYRRLQSNWATTKSSKLYRNTDTVARQPLPEYIPANLFSDLELPEVRIEPPEGYDPAAETQIPIAMALNELAPGKVTLRWAVQKVRGLWIKPPSSGLVDLEEAFADEGIVVAKVPGDGQEVPLVRPVVIRPVVALAPILPTSNARLRWRFLADLDAPDTEIPRPRSGPLGDLVPRLNVYLSSDRGSLTTSRYATRGAAEIVTRQGREHLDYTLNWRGEPAAVGYTSQVDAVAITVTVPESIDDFNLATDPERLRQLRTDRFTSLVHQEMDALGYSSFTADRVAEVALTIISEHVARGSAIDDLRGLNIREWANRAEQVVDAVLLIGDWTDPDEFPLRATILDAFNDLSVGDAVRSALGALTASPDDDWLPWVRKRYLQTFAAAWQEAAQQACEDFDIESDAVVDIVDSGAGDATVVISDAGPGGGGLVESLAREIADDPCRFDRLVAVAVAPSETEGIDLALRETLRLLAEQGPTTTAANGFRNAATSRLDAWQRLVGQLADEGIPRGHANLAALSLRIFRAGSGPQTDALLRLLIEKWDEIDERAGFAVDQRTVCIVLASNAQVAEAVRQINQGAGAEMSSATIQSVIQSLLWTRASARRAEALRINNRFVWDRVLTERTLVADLLPTPAASIDVASADWRDVLAESLKSDGSATIFSGNAVAMADAIRSLMVSPLELDWLFVHPRVEGVTRDRGIVSATVLLREAPQ
jgi:hypothetical protein